MPAIDCELVGDFALSPTGDHVFVGSSTGALVFRLNNSILYLINTSWDG